MPDFNFWTLTQFYFLLVCGMSILSVFMYAIDKRRAQLGEWRIREDTLQLVAFFGGWPGAIYAQRRFRHKTKKLSFQINFWLAVVAHLAIVGLVAYALIVWRLPPAALENRERPLQPAHSENGGWTPKINSIQQQYQKEHQGDAPHQK